MEFAIVAAPLIALMLAALQTSLVYFTQEALETSVEAAARSVVTGAAQTDDSAGAAQGMTPAQLQARFKQRACATLLPFLSCANLYVDVQSAQDWSGINTSVPTITYDSTGKPSTSFNYNLGSAGSVVLVRLFYLWPVQAAPIDLRLANAAPGQRLIIATSVAKIEAYS